MTFHRTMVTSVTTSVTTVNINTLRYFRFIWSTLKISIRIQVKMDVLKSDDLVKVRGRRGVKSPQSREVAVVRRRHVTRRFHQTFPLWLQRDWLQTHRAHRHCSLLRHPVEQHTMGSVSGKMTSVLRHCRRNPSGSPLVCWAVANLEPAVSFGWWWCDRGAAGMAWRCTLVWWVAAALCH